MEGQKDAGDLDDDKVCRFFKSEKHLVHECTKLRGYREKLKKYDKIDIVAITVDKSKTLPYFSLDVTAKNGIKPHKFMIDSGAEMSVIHVSVAKKFSLPLESTNTTIHGAGGGRTPVDFLTLIPFVINQKTYKIPALVSKSGYFVNKSILGKQFFAETDISVRVGDDGQWIMSQHTDKGTITLSQPKRDNIKQIHILSQEKPSPFGLLETSELENQAFRDFETFEFNNITLLAQEPLHKQAKNNPIPDLVEDESWKFHGQSDAYDIVTDDSQKPQWITIHSIDASRIFTKDWLETKIAESSYAEKHAKYTGVQANIKLKPGARELLKNSKPITQSPELVQYMKQHLDDMINLGQIEEVTEVMGNACPAFPVKKPGKKDYSNYKAWRMVVNLQDANQYTIRDAHPLPLIKAIFQEIATWKDSYFAKLDMTNGFSQMPLAEEDRWVTTFTTPHGLYRYKVLPMGACNSPSIFQRENDRILLEAQKQGRCLHVKIYVEDIFVGGRTLEELMTNVEEVIEEFLKHGRTMNFSKSEFGLTKATFLGFTLSADGSVSVDEDVFDTVSRKLTDILASSMMQQDCKKKAQSLLGTLNYFREFIFNFAHKIEFVNAFLRKGNTKPWTQKEDDRVHEIIIELQNSGRIRPINTQEKLIVQCDASAFGIAYIALQTDENGHYVICDMNSASLTKGQRDYCASYREAVALAFAVEHLRYKIQPEKIHAYTDNSALVFIFGKTVENKPILKIAEFLDQQGITLTHIKGSDNGGSDA